MESTYNLMIGKVWFPIEVNAVQDIYRPAGLLGLLAFYVARFLGRDLDELIGTGITENFCWYAYHYGIFRNMGYDQAVWRNHRPRAYAQRTVYRGLRSYPDPVTQYRGPPVGTAGRTKHDLRAYGTFFPHDHGRVYPDTTRVRDIQAAANLGLGGEFDSYQHFEQTLDKSIRETQ